MSAEVALLNPHHPGSGVGNMSPESSSQSAPQAPSTAPAPATTSRKRSRPEQGEESPVAANEDDTKRARGRPRLDTKDETAADRRRTQIRLAQRAYRNRKENAIQSLEKKVTDLKETNEEMSTAFMKLHDFAIAQGLLDQVPDFARQLQATTEQFLTLARRSSEEGANDDDDENSAGGGSKTDGKDDENSPPRQGSNASTASSIASPAAGSTPHASGSGAAQATPRQADGNVARPPAPLPAPNTTSTAMAPPPPPARPANFCGVMTPHEPAPATMGTGYEVVTHPTTENASFPYGMPAHAPQPQVPSPYDSTFLPPPPNTLGHNEVTFGRRLQRSTLEQALSLVDAGSLHPDLFKRVFGFCMLFEQKHQIKARLSNSLNMTTRETLHNWRYPFLHVGGAGTFLPEWQNQNRTLGLGTARPDQPVGNEGTVHELKPQNYNGYSYGPFDAGVTQARDKLLGSGHRIMIPGYEGDFFDADEIEQYLRQRGVQIPPLADYVTVEIDLSSFPGEQGTIPDWVNTDAFGNSVDHMLASATAAPSDMGNFGATSIPTTTASASARSHSPPVNDLSRVASTEASSVSDGSVSSRLTTQTGLTDHHDMVSSAMANPAMAAAVTASMEPSPPYYLSASVNNLLDDDLLSSFASHKPKPIPRRVVTVNVAVFINELIRNAVCLGRGPGYRPLDINNAFWIATQV